MNTGEIILTVVFSLAVISLFVAVVVDDFRKGDNK